LKGINKTSLRAYFAVVCFDVILEPGTQFKILFLFVKVFGQTGTSVGYSAPQVKLNCTGCVNTVGLVFKLGGEPFVTVSSEHCASLGSRDSSVGMATGYGLNGWVQFLTWATDFFSTPQRPDGLWDSPRLLSNGYRGSFPGQ
jgi:hypothetical protein